MILFFKVFMFRSRESMDKKRLIFGVKKEVEVEMIRDYGSRGRS
jgi:hypothetical protein